MVVDGIKGVSSMLKILTYPDQIVYDYMHLVCLGHMVALVKRWLPLLQQSNLTELDTVLMNLRLPHNISIIFNHSISDVSEWHAKHLRLFVLNVGLPCVTLHLPIIYSSHFAVYCLAIRFLHCPRSHDELDLAQSLIDYYCRAAPGVFDDSIELLSLHTHLHLVEQVKRHGGPAFSSAFCFESCIRHLKKVIHGTKNLASQIAYWCDLRTIVPRPEFRLQKPTGKSKISIASSHFDQHRSIFLTSLLTFGHDEKKISLFLRYKDNFITYHSFLYGRPFTCASFIVSYKVSDMTECLYGNIIIFYGFKERFFALVQQYKKINRAFFDFLDLPDTISHVLH